MFGSGIPTTYISIFFTVRRHNMAAFVFCFLLHGRYYIIIEDPYADRKCICIRVTSELRVRFRATKTSLSLPVVLLLIVPRQFLFCSISLFVRV